MKKILKIVIMVLIIAALVFVYFSYFQGRGDSQETVLPSVFNADVTGSSREDSSFSDGKELVQMLVLLKSIKLDIAFFKDKTFNSLADFSVEIVPEKIGRANPFLPVGTEAAIEEPSLEGGSE
jgi:hypothetical protein